MARPTPAVRHTLVPVARLRRLFIRRTNPTERWVSRPQWNETIKRLSLPIAILCGSLSLLPSAHGTSASEAEMDLGFEAAFPRPFYQKKYFGLAVTGASIVAAGTVTYFTGGAGAPAAATGVSTVASWVAGGGAGSYMAGLSTIGGWFGGNAILGAVPQTRRVGSAQPFHPGLRRLPRSRSIGHHLVFS